MIARSPNFVTKLVRAFRSVSRDGTDQKIIPAAYSGRARRVVRTVGPYRPGPFSSSMPIDAQVRVMRLTSVGDAPVGAASSELDLGRPLSWTAVSKIFRSTAMRAATVREGYFRSDQHVGV